MDINLFVLNYINNLNELNEKNIKKINYEVKETKSTENKEVKYSKEFKEFLKTSKQKNKIDTVIDEKCEINIFEKNIIQSEEIYFNFFELDVDNKMKYILDYIKRKKYILECDIYEKIKHIIEDTIKDDTKDIPLEECSVEVCYYKGKWSERTGPLLEVLNKLGESWNIKKLSF